MAATSKKKAKKKASKKTAAKIVTKKRVAKKAPSKKTSSKKAPSKKAPSKKTSSKKAPSKKAPSKKTSSKKAGSKAIAKVSKKTKKTVRARKSASVESLIHGIAPYKSRRREEYMNSNQLEHFQHVLRGWRNELVNEINRTIHAMQDETVNHPDPNDRATQETDMSLELRSRDRERKLIKKIDETLALIDSGDYGFCDKCGVEIGIARLEARPTASLCIDCKTLDEIREKQMN